MFTDEMLELLEDEPNILILDFVSEMFIPDEAVTTGPLTRSAPFVCEVDVKPYGC